MVRPGEPLHQSAGDGRREQGVARADRAHRGDELLGGDIVEQEAAGTGGERGVDVLVEVERGEDDDPAVPAGPRGEDPRSRPGSRRCGPWCRSWGPPPGPACHPATWMSTASRSLPGWRWPGW